MECTMPNQSRTSMQDMQEGAYPKKKKSVAGQFAAVKYKSETYRWTKKLNREDCGVDKYFLLLKKSKHCRKTISTVAFT